MIKFNTSGRAEELWSFPMGKIDDCSPASFAGSMVLRLTRGNPLPGDIQGHRIQRFRAAWKILAAPPQATRHPRRDDAIQKAENPDPRVPPPERANCRAATDSAWELLYRR